MTADRIGYPNIDLSTIRIGITRRSQVRHRRSIGSGLTDIMTNMDRPNFGTRLTTTRRTTNFIVRIKRTLHQLQVIYRQLPMEYTTTPDNTSQYDDNTNTNNSTLVTFRINQKLNRTFEL